LSTDPSSLKLGFAGTPDFAVPALERLAAEHRICAVFTQPDRPSGRGQALHLSPVKRRALELGLTVHQPPTFKSPEVLEILRAAQLDALVVVAYGLILPLSVLQLPRWGCINIHASLLPRWRGAAPIQRALLAGDDATGVTIMRMEAGLDTGPMLAARSVRIDMRDTAKTLHDRLALLGAELMAETLRGLRFGPISEVAQPTEGVTYAQKIAKAEALIQWQDSAAQIARKVRAFNPWPIAETRFNGEQLRIWDAVPVEMQVRKAEGIRPGTVLEQGDHAEAECIDVVCGSGVLRILRLQLAGRKPLPAGDFLRGQRLSGALFAAT
jgi:methionyl-tRNA formyltransferase